MDRRQALAAGASLPDHLKGAALFADISGFTPLTEGLVRELGPQRGAEELTRHLNMVYDSLISELHRFRGSVIGFSGDAITCWFDGDDGMRATACALAMQGAMSLFAQVAIPSGRTVSLAMKAAVATGVVRRFLVGDPEIQIIDVLAGATLDQLAAAEHHADKGEVVLDPAAVASLAERAEIAAWRDDEETGERFGVVSRLAVKIPPSPWDPIPPNALTEEQVRPWVLPLVYERLHSGQGEFLAELRPAVALFLRFGGIDYDQDEAAADKLDTYIRQVQRILARYEGTLLQLTIGDKGSYLYAAFGAPLAHEDDATRAASAALDLRALTPTLDFIHGMQIGISQGRMRTGAYGGIMRRTYGVLGDEVNLAARLMQAAGPGQILVSKVAQHATSEAFVWERLPDLRVKGKAEPVPTFSLIGIKESRSIRLQEPKYSLPMVGREAELSLMREKLARVLQGQGQLIGITAEAGMGKSRLVAEAICLANELDLTGYGGECQSYGTNTSYLVWQNIWRGFFDLSPEWPLQVQVEALKTQLGWINPALVPRLPLLGGVLNLSIPDNDLTASFDAKLRKTSLEALLVDCLRARASIGPLFLVLEDCHWLDPLSHDLLEVIGRAIVDLPVLVVLAYRPPEMDRSQALRISQLAHFTEVRLADFTSREAEQLIGLKLTQFFRSHAEMPRALVERITQRAQGNPFYIEELLNYLQDKDIDPRDTHALEQLELPASLHSLILSRIDQLTESQKITLKVASVIGRLFKAAMLWGVYPQLGERQKVKADLDVLARLDLTPLDTPEPELAYLFRHILTQEVAYETLPYATRAMLHTQIGQYIERAYSDSLDQYVHLLAYHYWEGQDWGKALQFNLLAAQESQREFANDTAVAGYQRALEAAIKLDWDARAEKLQSHESLGEVLTLIAQYDQALEHYAAARALVEAEVPSDQQSRHLADLCRKTAEVYERRSEYEIAFEWLEKGLGYLDRLEPTIEMARIYNRGTLVHRRQGKYEEAVAWCQKSLDAASGIETPAGHRAVAHAYYNLGGIFWRRGDLTQAAHFCHESVRIYQEIDDIAGLSEAFINLSNVYADQGEWDRAGDALRQSLALKQQIGDVYGQGYLANNLGYILLDRGEWDQAAALFAQGHATWQQVGSVWGEALILSNLAQVRIYQEDWAEARACLTRSETLFAEIGSEEYLPELERRWGEFYLKTSELDQALAHTLHSIKLAGVQEVPLEEGMSYRILGQVYLAQGDKDSAQEALRRSLQVLTDLNSEYEAAKTVLPLVRLALENGPQAADRALLAQAIQTFEKLGAQADLAQARVLNSQLDQGLR